MDILSEVLQALNGSDCDVTEIGKSVCGNGILCAHCGSYSGRQIIVTAGIHARECYTAHVVLRQVRSFPKSYRDGGAYFVPLVNPDGAAFFESGETFGHEFLKAHAAHRREWKANADGVDLNCNFDAEWGSGAQNTRTPGAHGFIGEYPLCAPESATLAKLTTDILPDATVSYHCMGGELYWEFGQDGTRKKRDLKLARMIARHIGVKRVDGDLDSAGGYKDWCVQSLGIPAVTIELIERGSHPFAPGDFERDGLRNVDLPVFILDSLARL